MNGTFPISDELQAGYENELKAAGPLAAGDVLVASGPQNVAPAFEKIIFIVDDGLKPLAELVAAGLWRAREEEMSSVTIPLLRSRDSWPELARGISIFAAHHPQFVETVTVVVNNHRKTAEALREVFARENEIDKQNRPGYQVRR